MNATKILWGHVFAVSATVLLCLWAATEWTAYRLAFQPELGMPWFSLLGWRFYQPAALFWWWLVYDAYAHNIFLEGGYIAGAGGIAALGVGISLSVWRAKETKEVTTYGSARWADLIQVRRARLLGKEGVILGRWDEHYLRHDGPEHVLCFAPTRSGQG